MTRKPTFVCSVARKIIWGNRVVFVVMRRLWGDHLEDLEANYEASMMGATSRNAYSVVKKSFGIPIIELDIHAQLQCYFNAIVRDPGVEIPSSLYFCRASSASALHSLFHTG